MSLKDKLVKLGQKNKDLRKHIRPVLDKISGRNEAEEELEYNMLDAEQYLEDIQKMLDDKFQDIKRSQGDVSWAQANDVGMVAEDLESIRDKLSRMT